MTDYRARIRNLDATYSELQERRLQLEKNWKMRRNYEKNYYDVRATQIQEELLEMEKEREQTNQRNQRIINEMDNMRNEHLTASKKLKEAREALATSKIEFLKHLQRTDPRWKEKVYNRKTHELAVLEAKRKQIQALPNNAALRSVDLEIARLKQMLEGRGFVPTTYSEREKTSRKSERVMSGDEEVKRIVDSIPQPQIYRDNEEEERKREQIERLQSKPQSSSVLKRGPAFLYQEDQEKENLPGRLSEIKEELRLSGFEEPSRKQKIVTQGRDTPPRAPLSNPRKGSLGKEDSKSDYEKMLELREATLARERRDSEERRQQRLEDERRREQDIAEEKKRQKRIEEERRRKQAAQEEEKQQQRLLKQKEDALTRLKELSDVERSKVEKKGSERDELKEMELEIDGELGEEGDSGDMDWENMFDSKLQREARMTRVGDRFQRQQMGGENITEQLKDADSYLRLIEHRDKLAALKLAGQQIERAGRGIVYDLEMHEDRELAAEQREMEYIRKCRKTSEGSSLVLLGNLCMNICKEGYELKLKNEDLIATSAQLMSTFESEEIKQIFIQFSQHLANCVQKRLVAQKDVADILLWAFARTMDQETRADVSVRNQSQIRYIFNCYLEDELLPKEEVQQKKGSAYTSPNKEEVKKESTKQETQKEKLPQAQGGLDVTDDEDEEDDDEDIDGDEFMDSWIEQNENFT